MKRSLKLIVLLTMLLCTTTAWARPVDHATTRQSVSTEIKGDANNDKTVDSKDVTVVENHILNRASGNFVFQASASVTWNFVDLAGSMMTAGIPVPPIPPSQVISAAST